MSNITACPYARYWSYQGIKHISRVSHVFPESEILEKQKDVTVGAKIFEHS